MKEQSASDLHLSTGNPPMLRIHGELVRVDMPPLVNDDLKALVYEIAPEQKIKLFEETGDVDFGYEYPGFARYRANFFNQKSGIAAVFRLIPSKVLTADELGLPPVLKKFSMLKKASSSSPAPPARANRPRWQRWSTTRTFSAKTTSSRSRIRSNSCTGRSSRWSITARSGCTPSLLPSALQGGPPRRSRYHSRR